MHYLGHCRKFRVLFLPSSRPYGLSSNVDTQNAPNRSLNSTAGTERFVRIAPNHIPFSNRVALDVIYGYKSGFTKGPFYEDKYWEMHFAGLLS